MIVMRIVRLNIFDLYPIGPPYNMIVKCNIKEKVNETEIDLSAFDWMELDYLTEMIEDGY